MFEFFIREKDDIEYIERSVIFNEIRIFTTFECIILTESKTFFLEEKGTYNFKRGNYIGFKDGIRFILKL